MKERRNINRRELIDEYFPFITRIVQRMGRSLPPGLEIDDLLNSAVIGLLIAAEKYDPTRNNKFTTYATFRIKGEIIQAFRDNDMLTRKSRLLLTDFERTKRELEKKTDHVNNEIVMDEMNLNTQNRLTLRNLLNVRNVEINENDHFDYEQVDKFIDKLNTHKLINERLTKALYTLNEKERKVVIDYYFGEEKTFKQIGKDLNLTESRISQIHQSVLKKLRIRLLKIQTTERSE